MSLSKQSTRLFLAALVTTSFSPLVLGQSQGDSQDQSDQRSGTQEQYQDQQDGQQQASRRSRQDGDRQMQQNRQSRRQLRVQPEGWITLGADYDSDGRYEALESIFIYDLQQARQQSMARRQRDDQRGARRSGQMRSDRYTTGRAAMGQEGRNRASRGQQRMRMQTVQGDIESLKEMKLAGQQQPFRMARLNTNRGQTQVVVLGRKDQLQQKLDLEEGDSIEVRGVRARVNDRDVVMAKEVRYDGQRVSVDLPRRARFKRVKAEVLNTRTVRFRGFDEPFLVGEVSTRAGKRQLVNFGPKSKFNDVDLGEGQRIRMLVRPGRVGGEQALIAQQVSVDDSTVRLPRPENQRRFRRSQQQGGDDQQG